jgi:hypothetical protein
VLAEVKGPVVDRLQNSELGQRLRQRVYLSVHEAFVDAADLPARQAARPVKPAARLPADPCGT